MLNLIVQNICIPNIQSPIYTHRLERKRLGFHSLEQVKVKPISHTSWNDSLRNEIKATLTAGLVEAENPVSPDWHYHGFHKGGLQGERINYWIAILKRIAAYTNEI